MSYSVIHSGDRKGFAIGRVVVILICLLVFVALGWAVVLRLRATGASPAEAMNRGPMPVEVAPIERGPIELRRVFSGTLEALAAFDVAPKVGGRIEQLTVDIGDTVERDQLVAQLDDDEYVQAVALAEAEVAVAKAQAAEAVSNLEVASRELERMRTLAERGVSSESELDAVLASHQAADAEVKVAEAQVQRAEAALATAEIRLGYTKVNATWVAGDVEGEGEGRRVVAHRHVDPGDTITANSPIVTIVQISPLRARIYVTEGDYMHIREGQTAVLRTDAFPGETFAAVVERISPVFRQESRQALVQLHVENASQRLKPGMFIRAAIVLDRAEDATTVPEAAITRRAGVDGVFVVADDGASVNWHEVKIGIRDAGRVQILDDALSGEVVTLGQQMLDDGSAITIPQRTGRGTSEKANATP